MENAKMFQMTQHRAAHDYECSCCKGIILKDEEYNKAKYSYKNYIRVLRYHIDCEVKEHVTL